jgi:Flp pilus assembly protein TadD/TolB-like protein
MTPERWQQIQGVLTQALAMPTIDRPRFVSDVCADDRELQSEVDSLLAHLSSASDFLSDTQTAVTREGVTPPVSLVGRKISRYTITARLGSGGMGHVYLAEDEKLERRVAVKALREDRAAGPEGLERLLREARAAAALNDPHIAAIYDVLEPADAATAPPCIVMEYVEGETLSDRLRRGPLSIPDALRIGEEIALALSAAHKQGIVHRDLKPANLRLRTDGRVKVLDFGLARMLPAATTVVPTVDRSGHSQSQPVHPVAGTPGYMSPEQTLGRAPQPPTDIFSFGVVLFQMITGRRPFQGDDFLSAAVAMMTTRMPRLGEFAPDVPVALETLVARMLAKEPLERPTAESVAAELERLSEIEFFERAPAARTWSRRIAAGIGALILVAGIGFGGWRLLRPPPAQSRPTIAVLPLTNLSGDSAKDYLGVGIAETLMTNLARVSGVSVISRTNINDVPRGADVRTIARDLGATMVLQGSVQQAGDHLRVSAKLLRPDGSVAWAGDTEAPATDLFTLESRLADSIIAGLPVSVPSKEQRNAVTPPTRNADALKAYWEGLAELDRAVTDPTYFDRAISDFQRAISLDANFSLAHAAMGNAYRRKSQATNDAGLMNLAAQQITAALSIDPDQSEIRLSLANLYRFTGRNGLSVEELRRVLAQQPLNDEAHRLLGNVLAAEGNTFEALQELQRAVTLRPDFWRNQQALGLFYLRTGKLDNAVATFKLLTELKPDDAVPYQQLGAAYQIKGDKVRARQNFERSIRLNPNSSSYSNLGTILFSEGKFEAAAVAYEDAIRLSPKIAALRRNVADTYLKLGRPADAKAAYQKAVELAEDALTINPSDAIALSQLGVYEAKLGRFSDAEQNLNRAVALNPTGPEVLYRRAVVLALNGKRDEAFKQLSEAILRGQSKQVAAEDGDLSSLRSLPAFNKLVGPAQ